VRLTQPFFKYLSNVSTHARKWADHISLNTNREEELQYLREVARVSNVPEFPRVSPRQFTTAVAQAWIAAGRHAFNRSTGSFDKMRFDEPDLDHYEWFPSADASLEEPNVQSDSQLCATKSTQAE
jgi:hypothetical protein